MDAFYGEIRIFGFTFPPQNWAQCNGQTLNVNQFQVLYTVIGVQFGGDGRNTFQLPNLQGSAVCQAGQGTGLTNRPFGKSFGASSEGLTLDHIPSHTHTLNALSSTGAQLVNLPTANVSYIARTLGQLDFTSTDTYDTTMALGMVGPSGSLQPPQHENRQPFLALNFCICTYGEYPLRAS